MTTLADPKSCPHDEDPNQERGNEEKWGKKSNKIDATMGPSEVPEKAVDPPTQIAKGGEKQKRKRGGRKGKAIR